MGGLVVLGVLAFFFWGCWIFSDWIIKNKAGKYYWPKRIGVFLIPALFPVYVQLVEYVLFQQACKEAVVYFPKEKIKAPEILITGDQGNKNQGRYFDGMFKYIVSPHYMNNRPIDLNKSKEQFRDYIVYPYKSRPLKNGDRALVFDEMRYAILFSPALIEDKWHSYKTAIYVYDFAENRKVSQVIFVFPNSYQRSLLGFFHARFEECPNKREFNYSSNDIIKNTFIMENK